MGFSEARGCYFFRYGCSECFAERQVHNGMGALHMAVDVGGGKILVDI